MTKYVFGKNENGNNLLDIQKTYEKIKVAARIIASIPDPSTITVRINKNFINKLINRPFQEEPTDKELFTNSLNILGLYQFPEDGVLVC
jgi:hypothetical protein